MHAIGPCSPTSTINIIDICALPPPARMFHPSVCLSAVLISCSFLPQALYFVQRTWYAPLPPNHARDGVRFQNGASQATWASTIALFSCSNDTNITTFHDPSRRNEGMKLKEERAERRIIVAKEGPACPAFLPFLSHTDHHSSAIYSAFNV